MASETLKLTANAQGHLSMNASERLLFQLNNCNICCAFI